MKMKENPVEYEVKKVEVKPATYALELSKKEMVVLASLVGIVHGRPNESEFRRVINDLWGGGFVEFFHELQELNTSIEAPKGNIILND